MNKFTELEKALLVVSVVVSTILVIAIAIAIALEQNEVDAAKEELSKLSYKTDSLLIANKAYKESLPSEAIMDSINQRLIRIENIFNIVEE